MNTPHPPHRRELLRPLQLLGLAFACAAFAGGVTAVTTGLFTDSVGASALPLALVVTGITFIVVLLGLSLLLLAVDPKQLDRGTKGPVLIMHPDDPSHASAATDAQPETPTDAQPDAGAGDAKPDAGEGDASADGTRS